MYDRLVHFCFGFLVAYPVREVFIRISRAKGFWNDSCCVPVPVTRPVPFSLAPMCGRVRWALAAG